MLSELDELAFRESVFSWLRNRMRLVDTFTRDDLRHFEFQGQRHRLVGAMTGIWRVKSVSDAAVSILTAYAPSDRKRPYDDTVGSDGMLRYKYRGTDPEQADNVWLRTAMQRHLPLVWFIGVGYVQGTRTQVFRPEFPVWLVAEEPDQHQFVVAVDQSQQAVPAGTDPQMLEIARRYNQSLVLTRHHQPLFRSAVLHAYERRCAVCRLPFAELLDAAAHPAGLARRPGQSLQWALALQDSPWCFRHEPDRDLAELCGACEGVGARHLRRTNSSALSQGSEWGTPPPAAPFKGKPARP